MIDKLARILVHYWNKVPLCLRFICFSLFFTVLYLLFIFTVYVFTDIPHSHADLFFQVFSLFGVFWFTFSIQYIKYSSSIETTIQHIRNTVVPSLEIEELTEALIERDTLLQRREEWFRAIVQSTKDGMVAFDITGKINLCNPAATAILGYDNYKNVYGRHITKVFASGESFEFLIKKWFDDVPPHAVVLSGKRCDGSLFPMSLTLSKGGANGHSFMIAIVRNLEKENVLC